MTTGTQDYTYKQSPLVIILAVTSGAISYNKYGLIGALIGFLLVGIIASIVIPQNKVYPSYEG